MGIQVVDNFSYQGKKPLDNRIAFNTVAEMVSASSNTLYDGCFAYVEATKKYYSFDNTNETDSTLGKWREYKSSTSELTNDSGFITNTVNNLVNYYLKSETYTQAEVNALISAIVTLDIQAVSTLPTEDISRTTIYLVPSQDAETGNIKDEYINLDGTTSGWELIGSTEIDLTGYVTDTELTTALADYTTTANLTTLLSGKVDKVSGKQLSTEDYTTAEKTKLASLENIQVSTMPTASASNEGDIVQYVGTTTSTYTNGYFYECVEDNGSYSWEAKSVQAGGGVSDFDDLTNRPQESDTIDIDDLDLPMPAKPTEYPVLFDETGTEYKVGWYKRASDGKVKSVWRKDVDFGKLPNSANKTVAHSINNIDKIVNIQMNGFSDVSKEFVPLPYVSNSNLSAQVRWYADSTNIYFFTGVDMSSYECFSCIFFTKTTDSWKEV